MKRITLTLAAMLSIVPATVAHAQFGSGIVFDPTQSAHAITQVKQQYNLDHQMILAPRMLYSRFLSPTTDLRMLQQISNTYGNSAGWVNSANTGNGASAAYQQVSVPHTNNVIPGYGG